MRQLPGQRPASAGIAGDARAAWGPIDGAAVMFEHEPGFALGRESDYCTCCFVSIILSAMSQISIPTPTPPRLAPGLPSDALMPSPAAIERFLAHCQLRRYPARSEMFRPGDPANTMYYIVSGSVSIIAQEDNGHELIVGYFGPGEFVGEMGLFVTSDTHTVILRSRTYCALAEISYERLFELLLDPDNHDALSLVYAIGSQLSRRLRDTTRKAGRLAFLDVSDRVVRTLFDLAQEPEAMSHPQGTQLKISRQELAQLVGCSREMAGRVLKKLQEDGKLHARGKTLVLYHD